MTTNRFHIAKDLVEWAKDLPESPWGNLADSNEKNWKFHFSGDEDLKKFIHIYEQDIAIFQKYFPNIDIWLKNIFWSPLFDASEKILENILEKIEKNSLVIAHMSPLEMAIVGETLGLLGAKNVIYNFNRQAAVNSKSKTLEATLFLVAWRETPWLSEKLENLALKFPIKNFENILFFLDENDIPPKWNISECDDYVKNAIGWKENAVTYKVDDLPSREFLLQKNIKNIYFFDQDDSSKIDDFYEKRVGDIFKIKKWIIPYCEAEKIGYYEEYVVAKNREYIEYRKNILAKAEKISLQKRGGIEKSAVTSENNSLFKKSDAPRSLTKWESILAGFSLVTLFIIFIALVTSSPSSTSSGSTSSSSSSSSWGFRFGGGGNWGSSFSSSSSSSSSDSSISSFGGGGFSKSSGG